MKNSFIRVVIHILVLVVVVALVITLMPGVRLGEYNPGLLLSIAITLGLLNAVLRPILVILTGRLLISTLGLFLVVVNCFVFWLLYTLLPGRIIVENPVLLRLMIAGTLTTLGTTISEAVLGLNRPDITIEGGGKGIWKLLDRLPVPRRNALLENFRLEQVYDTLSVYGMDILVGQHMPLRRVRQWVGAHILHNTPDIDDLSTPAKVRVMLQQLGPTWVKIGQIASSQAGTLPPDWAEELAKLQNTVEPFPFEDAKRIIEKELKAPLTELFASIEEKPFAAASTAQVHRAVLCDGSRVVVKVQRPNIIAQTQADLGVMESVAAALNKRIKAVRPYDLPGTLREFSDGILDELDYTIETYNAQRLADVVRGIDRIHIVGVHAEMSTPRVMVMDMVEGVKVTNTAALAAAGVDCDILAVQYINALCKQVLIDGFFHGDPHPGNLLVSPKTGDLTMIDCGMIGELTPEQRLNLLDFMMSLAKKDVDGLSAAVLSFCKRTRRANIEAYNVEVRRMIYRHVVYATNPDLRPFLNAITGSLFEFGLKMDSNFTLAIKAILQAEEAAITLSPSLNLLQVINTAAQSMIRERFSPEQIRGVIEKEAMDAGRELLHRVPALKSGAYKWLDNIAAGGVQVKIDTSELSHQVTELDGVLRRVVVGLVLGGLIIGMAIFSVGTAQVASTVSTSTGDYTVPLLATVAFGIVTAFSLIVIWRVARPPHKEGV